MGKIQSSIFTEKYVQNWWVRGKECQLILGSSAVASQVNFAGSHDRILKFKGSKKVYH